MSNFYSICTDCYSTVTVNTCKHSTGWYSTIKFWIFSKTIFICEECFTVLDAKKVRR